LQSAPFVPRGPAKTILAALACVVASRSAAAAPHVHVRGHVVDAVTGSAVRAIIQLDGGATTASDATGAFTVDAPPGAQVFVYADGYVMATVAAAVGADLRVALVSDPAAGEVIEIEGTAPDLAPPTAYRLDRDDVRAIAGAGNDVLHAAQALPGVARVPFGLGGLVLRGASPAGTAVYLDGVEVPNAFHLAAGTSFFPSTLLDAMTVMSGGGEVAWGRNTGGVVELRSRAPRGDRWRDGVEVDLTEASAIAEGPTPLDGAIEVGVRRSHIDVFFDDLEVGGDRLVPRYQDAQLRWDVAVAGGRLTALAFISDDHLLASLSDLRTRSARLSVPYRRSWGRTLLTVTPWIGRDSFAVTESAPSPDEGKVDRVGVPMGLRADLLRDTTWGHVAGGVELRGERARYQYWLPDRVGRFQYDNDHADLGAWAELRWRIAGGRMTVRPGLRADHFGTPDEWAVDPRLTFAHELGGGVILREALGVHHRPPSTAAGDLALRASRATHGSIDHVSGLTARLTPSGTSRTP